MFLNRDRKSARSHSPPSNTGTATFCDNRPVCQAQRNLQGIINNSQPIQAGFLEKKHAPILDIDLKTDQKYASRAYTHNFTVKPDYIVTEFTRRGRLSRGVLLKPELALFVWQKGGKVAPGYEIEGGKPVFKYRDARIVDTDKEYVERCQMTSSTVEGTCKGKPTEFELIHREGEDISPSEPVAGATALNDYTSSSVFGSKEEFELIHLRGESPEPTAPSPIPTPASPEQPKSLPEQYSFDDINLEDFKKQASVISN
ncbi:hypothetical protein FUAX_27790 [Fulvitalea axinellae]|uniref:Uncharacterized protein n=1 Tax=Fulvitalea axinellae TaxID=1182444 RepID=A0AAU9CQV6_9BACT|nr:hypothetical protein FUAX_27790 [Fulvitalea axinellae]